MINNKKMNIAITGGSEGLGLELAKYFTTYHNSLVATCGSRKQHDIEIDFKDYPNIFYQSIDLSKKQGPDHFLNFVKEKIGDVDLFINNAVSFQNENIFTDTRDFILDQFLINTVLPLEFTQKLYHQYSNSDFDKKSLSIIMINSETAIQPKPNLATYAATKSALLNYTKSLAIALKGSKISICSLILGPLGTPYYVGLYEKSAQKALKTKEEFIESGLKKTFPSLTYSNLISMEEVAKTILFLNDLGPTKNGCSWRLDAGVIPIAI